MNSGGGLAATPPKLGATLKRPVQIVKKRSGPLDDALAELQIAESATAAFNNKSTEKASAISDKQKLSPDSSKIERNSRVAAPTTTSGASLLSRRRQASLKEKKRERWLLTRKTWKYMTDAGRKLIPEAAQNRKEDIPKIEAHFQQVCNAEPRFVLWRRKCSYPGATRLSKRHRLKQLLQHSGRSGQQQQQQREREDALNADRLIELLYSHLQLDSAYKTTTLLSAKTVRPDQTSSPSAQRPTTGARQSAGADISTDGSNDEQQQIVERLRFLLRNMATAPDWAGLLPREHIGPDMLRDKQALKQIYNALRKQQLHRALHTTKEQQNVYGSGDFGTDRHAPRDCGQQPPLKHSTSLSSLLHYGLGSTFGGTKQQQKQHLRQQEQHQEMPLQQPSTTSPAAAATLMKKTFCCSGAGSGDSGAAIDARSSFIGSRHNSNADNSSIAMPPTRLRKPPNTLPLDGALTNHNKSARKNLQATARGSGAGTAKQSTTPKKKTTASPPPAERQFNTCGTQTSFIQLQEIKRLAEEYKEQRKLLHEEEAIAGGAPNTDEELDARPSAATAGPTLRRKSSIDNEDVSQSVSDTIKRYLRMARKKSVLDDTAAANRFKRCNYDRNLRNIRAKGEINPPGMDEDNSKAVQTLDAWPLITLNFIRGIENTMLLDAAHSEWLRALEERLRKKHEFEEKLKVGSTVKVASVLDAAAGGSPARSDEAQFKRRLGSLGSSSSSAPTSPTMESSTSTALGQANNSSSNAGIFHSSSQFFSNLWHGTSSLSATVINPTQQPVPSDSNLLQFSPTTIDLLEATIHPNSSEAAANVQAMQKSKSSSNVGQFVSRKLLKSRSKSQTRTGGTATIGAARKSSPDLAAEPLFKWMPSHELTWRNERGEEFKIDDIALHQLSSIEAQMLRYVALQKINELNIGISLNSKFLDSATGCNNNNNNNSSSKLKRRVLPKKKAMTTSFFDIGSKKQDDSNAKSGIFGASLEMCLAYEQKRRCGSTQLLGEATSERGSRNSIASLFRHSMGAESSGDDLRSCGLNGGKTLGHLSYSQTDVRQQKQHRQRRCSSSSQDCDEDVASQIGADDMMELQIPEFVNECIKYLEKHGLQQIGLFRVSTSKKRVKQLREDFNRSAYIRIEADTCPHDVATLLKEYLRDLPEPLLCTHLHKPFLETQRIRNRRLQLEAISHLVKLLPAAHRDTLYALLKFLAKVAAHSDDVMSPATATGAMTQVQGNKMDSNNLATVFAPNILRIGGNDAPSLSSASSPAAASTAAGCEQQTMCDAINVVRIMIDHFEEIYRVPAELLHSVYAYMLDDCPQQLYMLCQQRNAVSIASTVTKAPITAESSLPPQSPSSQQQQQQCIVSIPVPPKRLYTRVSVMHDNDAASCNTPTETTAGAGTEGGSTATKHYHYGYAHSNTHQQLEELPKQQESSVLLASLQISAVSPTHATATRTMPSAGNTASANTTAPGDVGGALGGGGEYIYMPYIEDSCSEYAPVSGLLSFSTKSDVPTNSRHVNRRRLSASATEGAAHVVESSTSSAGSHRRIAPDATEPRLPASISNIGGDIMRSKTADFERMSSSKRALVKRPQATKQKAEPSANSTSTPHLYKRQELIASKSSEKLGSPQRASITTKTNSKHL